MDQVRKSLGDQVKTIREDCYRVYRVHNKTLNVPVKEIDERIDKFVQRFLKYTKLNNQELKDAVSRY